MNNLIQDDIKYLIFTSDMERKLGNSDKKEYLPPEMMVVTVISGKLLCYSNANADNAELFVVYEEEVL